MAVAKGTARRRGPTQRRAQSRVDRMLDSTGILLDEVGYEKMTTTMIADHSNCVVGSLYQYFGNKGDMVEALRVRIGEQFLDRWQAHVDLRQDYIKDLPDIMVTIVPAMLDVHLQCPGAGQVPFHVTHVAKQVALAMEEYAPDRLPFEALEARVIAALATAAAITKQAAADEFRRGYFLTMAVDVLTGLGEANGE